MDGGEEKKLSAANLLQPILEGCCLNVGAIIGNRGLLNSFTAEQCPKSLKSEVSISFLSKKRLQATWNRNLSRKEHNTSAGTDHNKLHALVATVCRYVATVYMLWNFSPL